MIYGKLKCAIYNLFLAGVVFLPTFLLIYIIELKFIDLITFEEGFLYHLGAVFIFYLGMIIAVMIAALVYSAFLALLPNDIPVYWRKILSFLLAPTIPLLIIVFGLSGKDLYANYLLATIVATITYGVLVTLKVK